MISTEKTRLTAVEQKVELMEKDGGFELVWADNVSIEDDMF
jgi:hypothetical protein